MAKPRFDVARAARLSVRINGQRMPLSEAWLSDLVSTEVAIRLLEEAEPPPERIATAPLPKPTKKAG